MTDTIERVARAIAGEAPVPDGFVIETLIDPRTSARRALQSLTPGSRWTAEDGTEMIAVPVEANSRMLALAFEERHVKDGQSADIWVAMLSAAGGE